MSWNYRILVDGDKFNVHEVYYDDDDGEPIGWTIEPVTFGGESLSDVHKTLEMALKDARRLPPLRIVDDKLQVYEPEGDE